MEETRDNMNGRRLLKHELWRPEEDRRLVNHIIQHGDGNWKEVPKATGLPRSANACRLRWRDQIKSILKNGSFSHEETKRIKELHSECNKRDRSTEHTRIFFSFSVIILLDIIPFLNCVFSNLQEESLPTDQNLPLPNHDDVHVEAELHHYFIGLDEYDGLTAMNADDDFPAMLEGLLEYPPKY